LIDEEILMLRILILQVIVAILCIANIGAADWLYQRGRIRQRLHSLWVSASSTAICLPMLAWTGNVFLGFGVVSQALVSTLGALIFVWVYCRLRKVPASENVAGPITSAEIRG
jgi:hypothetical protein